MRVPTVFSNRLRSLRDDARRARFHRLHRKYRAFTMVKPADYAANCAIADDHRNVPGCVVECGTWRGGMIAGIAGVLGPERHYHLFDSFEGLPPPGESDGPAAHDWAANPDGPDYHDNCTASEADARRAMAISGAPFTTHRGWFNATLPGFDPGEPISVLRLDADWYESTLCCLENLFPRLARDGIVIIDDYYTWDGCARAVHHYLARESSAARLRQHYGIATFDSGRRHTGP